MGGGLGVDRLVEVRFPLRQVVLLPATQTLVRLLSMKIRYHTMGTVHSQSQSHGHGHGHRNRRLDVLRIE
jgi:hypothetical protein